MESSHGLVGGPRDKLATIVLNRAAVTPTRLRGRGVSYRAQAKRREMEIDDQDEDAPVAEIEEDEEEEEEVDEDADAEGEADSDADAEGEVEDDDDDDDGEIVGAVKTRSSRSKARKASEDEESEAEIEEDQEEDSDADSDPDGEEEWEVADDADDDQKIGISDANRCVYVVEDVANLSIIRANEEFRFCGQSEENDPSEEFEEYLACSVCGDNGKSSKHKGSKVLVSQAESGRIAAKRKNDIKLQGPSALTSVPAAHRQCARNAGSLAENEGTSSDHRSRSCMSLPSKDIHKQIRTDTLSQLPNDGDVTSASKMAWRRTSKMSPIFSPTDAVPLLPRWLEICYLPHVEASSLARTLSSTP